MNRQSLLATVLSLLIVLPMANAQSVTGQMYGVVTDSTGAVVSGATIKLTNDNSQAVISYETAANGSFAFIGLFPAVYNLKVSHPGFKSYEQRNIRVNTQERVDLNEIKLEVGDIATSIAVEASAARAAEFFRREERRVRKGGREVEEERLALVRADELHRLLRIAARELRLVGRLLDELLAVEERRLPRLRVRVEAVVPTLRSAGHAVHVV